MARRVMLLAAMLSAASLCSPVAGSVSAAVDSFAAYSGLHQGTNRTRLMVSCDNLEKGTKVMISSTAATLQEACQLRVEVNAVMASTLQLVVAVSPLTDMVGPDDFSGTYMGKPKVFSLVNKTVTIAASDVNASAPVALDDVALGGLTAYLDGQCGTVYLLAALFNGTQLVDYQVLRASIQCPDESDVDIAMTLNRQTSWRIDYDGALLVDQTTPSIPVQLTVENRGSAALTGRTDPDAIRVWVYVKRVDPWWMRQFKQANSTIVYHNQTASEVMPSVGDMTVSISNVFGLSTPGSPGIGPGSAVPLSLSELAIPEHMCGDGLIVINVDPLGEVPDTNRTNNALGIHIRSSCIEDAGRCYTYGTERPGVTLVALHHNYMMQPTSVIEYHAATNAIRQLNIYDLKMSEKVDMIKAVALSYAVQSEANRLENIGSCDFSDAEEHLSWEQSVLGRLAASLASIRRPLSNVRTTSEFESEELGLLASVVETIGQLMQQRGDLRTLLTTIIHGDMTMFSDGGYPGGHGGYPGGHGGYSGSYGGYPGGHGGYSGSYGGYPGGHGGYSGSYGGYPGGHGGYSGSYGGYPGGHGGYSGSYGSYSGSYGGYPGDYSGYSGSYGSYSGSYGGYPGGHGGYSGSGSWSFSGSHGFSSGGYGFFGSANSYDYSGSGFYSGSSFDYSGSGSYSGSDYDYSGSGLSGGNYDSGSGSYSGSDYDFSGSGSYSGSNFDYSGSSFSDYSYSDYSYSDYSYSDYSSGADVPQYLFRKKRSIAASDMFPSYEDGDAYGSGGHMDDGMSYFKDDMSTHWSNGMDMPHDIGSLMGPIVRLQMFFSKLVMHVAVADYKNVQLPGCFPEAFSDNFRRFLKALLWRTTPIQQIPGYEEISEEFVTSVRQLIGLFASEKAPALLSGRLPRMFEDHMGDWARRRGMISPLMPLPHGIAESALREVVAVSQNFTVDELEKDPALKNQSLVLLGKVARALLDNNRQEVLDKCSQAAMELHGLLATGDLSEATGKPGKMPSNNDICKKVVEMFVKKESEGMNTPLLVMRDGDVYSVRPSPLTNQLLWKKVVACECSAGVQDERPFYPS